MNDNLDPAFVELLADPRSALRRPPDDLPIEVIRAAANRFMARAQGPQVHMIREFAVPGPAGDRRVRLYRPSAAEALPILLFCHGGGFAFGNFGTHDAMCRTLATEAQGAVLAIDYRLAPEFPFPAALDDCHAALRWIEGEGGSLGVDTARIAIAGDSAGGQLAIATALQAKQAGRRIDHVGLLYPMLDPGRQSASARTLGEGYMLTTSFLEWAWEAYGGAAGASDNPFYDVGRAALNGFPSTTIVTAALDPLCDEGEAFAKRLEEAGVAVNIRRYDGMIHGFAGMPQLTPVAGKALAFIGREIRASWRAAAC